MERVTPCPASIGVLGVTSRIGPTKDEGVTAGANELPEVDKAGAAGVALEEGEEEAD